jgi:hypothetical protein
MNQPVPIGATTTLPALVTAASERASVRFLEFFAANIRNPHPRRAYYRAAEEFLAWCAKRPRRAFADEGPLETTSVRITKNQGICYAPQYVAEELLRDEGFTDIRFIDTPPPRTYEIKPVQDYRRE